MERQTWRWRGKVIKSVGNTIESAGPVISVGECCEIEDAHGVIHWAEVIGFRGENVLSMPLEKTDGIRFGDAVFASGVRPSVEVSGGLVGRILDAEGNPLQGAIVRGSATRRSLESVPRNPLDRMPIQIPMGTGVRAIDALLTVGRGQRVGIFGGSGVGKSTLIGIMTRNTAADITVVALIGERGREVPEFIQNAIGEAGLARSILVVSTSD